MLGCASSSPPLTPVALSSHGKTNPGFLGVSSSSSVPFPSPPTLRLPPRRTQPAGARAAYASSAAAERERESEHTTSTGGGYSYSYSSSYSRTYNSPTNPMYAAAPAAAPPPSLYDVLGLSPRATAPEIKAAYRRLARSCHPDAASKGTGASASAEEFMRVHAAYATLSDPDKRAEYDRGLAMSVSSPGIRAGSRVYPRTASYPAAGSRSSTYSGSAGFQSGFGRRTWETDQCW